MWCGKCQADVAAEVSPDNLRVFCAGCSTLLSTIDVPPALPASEKINDRTKDARELLQRWSSGKMADPFGPPILASTSSVKPQVDFRRDQKIESTHVELPSALPESNVRVPAAHEDRASPTVLSTTASVSTSDTHHSPEGTPAFVPKASEIADSSSDVLGSAKPNPLKAMIAPSQPTVSLRPNPLVSSEHVTSPNPLPLLNPLSATVPSSKVFRIDSPHEATHFASASTPTSTAHVESVVPFASSRPQGEIKRPRVWFPKWDSAAWRSEPGVSANWSALAGQFLAYAGVLAMTAGACLAVWSHFGGPTSYAPTGWLLATAGQMLLFFGVVTLVSGGLEQTTEQVNKRIEQLGDHIIRIEQAAREMSLRGGSIPASHFANDADASEPQQLVASGHERSVVEK